MTDKPRRPPGESGNPIAEAIAAAQILSRGDDDAVASIVGDKIRDQVRRRGDVIDEMNGEWAFVLMGSRAVIIRELPLAAAPTHELVRVLSLDAFSAYLANQGCVIECFEQEHGQWVGKPKFMRKAPMWLTSQDRRTFDGVEFFPDPQDKPGLPRYFNLWRGFSLAPDTRTPPAQRRAKYAIFADHLLTNICAGNAAHFEWLFSWFAWIIQRPRERLATSVVLRGDQGTGKTVAGSVVGSLIDAHYFLVDDPRYLVGQFNAHLASCLLLQVDEGFWAGDKTAEGRLKGLISAKKQMIEAKGIDPIQVENRVNVLFSSNEGWVVPAGMGERRHAVFDVASHAKENHGYFQELYAQLDAGGRAALLADLLAYDFDAPGAGNPRVIPKTSALLEQKIRSFDPVTSWWYGRLVDGAQTHRAAHWRPHVPSQTVFNDYLRTAERIGIRRRAAETEFGIRLRELVPGLQMRKRTEDVEDIGEDGRPTTVRRQVRCYEFPPLVACRAGFEDLLHQQVAWDDGAVDGESADASRENQGADDDARY